MTESSSREASDDAAKKPHEVAPPAEPSVTKSRATRNGASKDSRQALPPASSASKNGENKSSASDEAVQSAANLRAVPSKQSRSISTSPHRLDSQPGNLSYDPALADRSVRLSRLVNDRRFWQMTRTALSFISTTAFDRLHKAKTKEHLAFRRQRRAVRFRKTLVDLGETFIKFGQFLSVRRDFMPVEMADELSLLQDKVPAFSHKDVRRIIEQDLGAPPERLFSAFLEEPIASASIGQVHLATLKDGTQVVVKVQRPDLSQRFYQDLGYMRCIVRWGKMILPQGQWDNWMALSDEFGRTLFSEIDYLQEGKNADKIRQFLKDHPHVRIPRVFWKYTGRRVLTLEYVPGTKMDNVQELRDRNLNLEKLGKELVSCYLDQVLLHGFFHADPHAGNLSVDDSGRIVIYDFGMIGQISEVQKEAITGCISAVIRRNTPDLVRNLQALGIINENAQIGPVSRTLEPFIDYYAGKEIRELDFTHLEHDIDEIAHDRSLCLPPTLAYLLRAGTSLEGIARTLQSNFSFVEAAKPALKKWMMTRPQDAIQLLKLLYNGNVTLGEQPFFKLSALHQADGSASAGRASKAKNGSNGKASTVPVPERSIEEVELARLKRRVKLLETQLQNLSQRSARSTTLVIALLACDLLFLGTNLIAEYRPYTHYFLIGNGVMGAIILWHLLTPVTSAGKSKKAGEKGGNGDKRC